MGLGDGTRYGLGGDPFVEEESEREVTGGLVVGSAESWLEWGGVDGGCRMHAYRAHA